MFDFLKRKLKVKEAPEEFFEDVKKQSENAGSLVPFGTNLEFDPATGQFKTTAKLAGSGDGDIVTEMTEKGFA